MPGASDVRRDVMISSTVLDLPKHRKEVMDACLRQGMFPSMMDHLPASDGDAISASLKLVDEADIYVGVFAYRYGYVPKENNPQQISVTEMEYDRAVERKIPRLIFIIDKNYPLADFTINDIDTGEGALKLAQFKSRVETENIINPFTSPADLRAHVIYSLSQHRQPALAKFPTGEFWEWRYARSGQLSSLSDPSALTDEGVMFNMLALRYKLSGQPGRAAPLQRHANMIASETKRDDNLSTGLGELSDTLRLLGTLCESESAARRALVISRELGDRAKEAVSLQWLGLTLAAQDMANESESALQRALRIYTALSESEGKSEGKSLGYSFLTQKMLWLDEFKAALSFVNRAWELARAQNLEHHLTRAARRRGEAALGLNDFATADEWLDHALKRARDPDRVEVEEQLAALVALAELRWRQGETQAAREFLDGVWGAAERGPYKLIHADACNVLAQVERDAGEQAKAVEAARRAYELAWCDGPPFAYHWGLEKARALLKELGAGEPLMPPFDESKFEPMPEVEIDPADEFGGGGSEVLESGE